MRSRTKWTDASQCAKKTANLLPSGKTCVIKVGPDSIFRKKHLVLGVVAREYGSGRKRSEWISEIRKIPGVKVKFTNGKYPWLLMPRFYKSIDYLLILSSNEGGPIPLQEALRMGKPVISSDVGFVSDYSTFRYESLPELIDLIKGLIVPLNIWDEAAKSLVEFCGKVRPAGKKDLSVVRNEYRGEIERQKSAVRKLAVAAPMWIKNAAKFIMRGARS